MCGVIAAIAEERCEDLISAARAGMDQMVRRGPDDEGLWHDDRAALGSRRLAILDLDHRAAQPMQSHCGRFVIAYNGEIYNFWELRHSLESAGAVFRTTSDTEVVLELFAR